MDRTVIIENSPQCCHKNPKNTILVEDYRGNGEVYDYTLHLVHEIIKYCYKELVYNNKSIPSIISSLHGIYSFDKYKIKREGGKRVYSKIMISVLTAGMVLSTARTAP